MVERPSLRIEVCVRHKGTPYFTVERGKLAPVPIIENSGSVCGVFLILFKYSGMTILSWTTALGVGRFVFQHAGEVTLWWDREFIFITAVCGLIRSVHVLLPPAVAQEFGLSQTASAASGSQQPQQASSTVHILSLLLRLRQCCCHLSLLKKVSSRALMIFLTLQ